METPARSFIKALVWQLMGLALMAGVGMLVTGSLQAGGKIALVNSAIGLVTYLIYERVWARVGWGCKISQVAIAARPQLLLEAACVNKFTNVK